MPDVRPVNGGDGGGGGSSDCNQIANDLQNLGSSLALFQSKLNTTFGPDGPGTERDNLRNTIAMVTDEISAVEARQRELGCLETILPQPHACSHVFDSPIYGRISIGGVICKKWESLDSETTSNGESVQKYLGFPIENTKFISQVNREYIVQLFERGMIVDVQGTDNPVVVYGPIYLHYHELGGSDSFLGAPLTDEAPTPNGGRFSHFENGDIYWRGDTGAWEVHGDIRNRWYALRGPAGVLGYPTSDEMSVLEGRREIGRVSRFETRSRDNAPPTVGAIYWSPKTGAWEVFGPIFMEWQQSQNGPLGKLGFPISGLKPTPNGMGRSQQFEHGMIVWHPDSTGSVTIMGGIALKLFRFTVSNDDFNVQINITASTGQTNHGRMPSGGQYNSGSEAFPPETLLTIDTVRPDLVIDIWMEAISEVLVGEDNRQGTIIARYDVDNVWGLRENSHEHHSGAFTAVLEIQPRDQTLEAAPFRKQLFWPFANFTTDKLSWNQYEATFRDVAETDKHINLNPLDHPRVHLFEIAFYEAAYNALSEGGNCFGMCLESIYAREHRSLFTEPIFSSNSYRKDGKQLAEDHQIPAPENLEVANEINIKHGYQLGADFIIWFLGKSIAGALHDPVRAFRESRDAFNRGDWPILTISDKDKLAQTHAHVVVPYAWDPPDEIGINSQPISSQKWTIYVANPNYPPPTPGNDPHCKIVIDPFNRTFEFLYAGELGNKPEVWTGGFESGGRLLTIPYSELNSRPVTPGDNVFELLATGALLILAADGETRQITDENGRTFYRYDENGAKRINEDNASRISKIALLPIHQNAQGRVPELYYWQRDSAVASNRIRQEVHGPGNGAYKWSLHSAPLSAIISAVGSGDTADNILVDSLGTAQQNVSFSTPRGGDTKKVSISIAGWFGTDGQEVRWFELKQLNVVPGQSIQAQVLNAGRELTVHNDGPAISFDLHIHSGLSEQAAVRRKVQIPSGRALRVQPADWAAGSLHSTTVHAEEMNHLGGFVFRRFEL